jgi:hypothetical protein
VAEVAEVAEVGGEVTVVEVRVAEVREVEVTAQARAGLVCLDFPGRWT